MVAESLFSFFEKNLGITLKAVELSENRDMLEIWGTPALSPDTATMYGFLGYDKGVVTL